MTTADDHHRTDDTATVAATGFLTRAGRSWWWSSTPTSEPVEVDDDTAASLVTAAHGAGWRQPAPGWSEGRSTEAPAVAELATPLTGRAVRGHLLIEGSDGQPVLLSPDDVRAIGQADRPGGWPVDAEIGGDLRARLAAAGLLVVHVAPRVTGTSGPSDESGGGAVVPPVRRTDLPGLNGPTDRVPVYAPWHPDHGPLLALGMLTANARRYDDGRLNQTYEIHVPETADEVLADLSRRTGPAVLLCSDYVWNLADNLALARAAAEVCPDLLVIHGGPSCPKYAGDAEDFLRAHRGVADVLVRGEGEHALVETLLRLEDQWPRPDLSVLADVTGLTYLDPVTDAAVRTHDRERSADLDELPSPYLTGEFDHIDAESWRMTLSIETNRGCPYGCTFCDWGSATLSRIRKFDLDRVTAELEWAAARGVAILNIPDANFGIMSRDVEIARRVAHLRRSTGFPHLIGYYPAKNTTKHLAVIMDVLMEAGVGPSAPLSLQSTDPTTLEAIARSNISNDHFVALASEFRRRALPLQGELILGLPGQTVESYAADLQFLLDHEITPRTWPLQVLPNAPMNDPEYRATHRIEVDERHLVVATSTAGRDDRARMIRLRNTEIVTERYGLLRHVLRWLQWDHGIAALDVMDQLIDVCDDRANEFPVLTWTLANFDLYPVAAIGWTAFYGEVRRYVTTELGIEPDTDLDTVLTLQQFLMPAPGRTFPASIDLAHDYVAYYRSATDELYRSGRAGRPDAPLRSFAPSTFTVVDDPLALCANGLQISGDSRNERLPGDFVLGANSANELDSPLMRYLPWVAANGIPPVVPADLAEHTVAEHTDAARTDADAATAEAATAVPVALTRP